MLRVVNLVVDYHMSTFEYSPGDCDFTTGKCPDCGKEYKHGTRRNCPAKKGLLSGPGTELRKLLKDIGVKVNCHECRVWAMQMNRWGPDGCREHRAEIIARLKEAANESSWHTVFTAAGGLITKPWFSLRDPYGSIVDEAIRRAETS